MLKAQSGTGPSPAFQRAGPRGQGLGGQPCRAQRRPGCARRQKRKAGREPTTKVTLLTVTCHPGRHRRGPGSPGGLPGGVTGNAGLVSDGSLR